MKTTIYVVMISTGEYSDREVKTWRAYNNEEAAKREVERLDSEFEKIGLCRALLWTIGEEQWKEEYNSWAGKIRSADLGDPNDWISFDQKPTWYVEPCELIVERNAK